MRKAAAPIESAAVTVGIAAERGSGVAFATVEVGERVRTLRVAFDVAVSSGLDGRDVTYAALSAVARRLLESHIEAADFTIADDRLGLDLTERHRLPAALTLPYVTLRCRLNQFRSHSIRTAADRTVQDGRVRDLTARARAELSLHVAA